MPNADEEREEESVESEEDLSGSEEMRKELMEMELDELKTSVLADIKEMQPDVELPGGGREEIVAWAIEWVKAREARAKPDEAALRAIRAADTALQERWPESESPRS